jgi:menaquinol-cytochrome c reductase cytochrome b/c subunit
VNEEQKKKYLAKYYQEKRNGVKFYPDVIYKDVLVAFALFLLLVGLALYVGVAPEPPADPNDSAYVPRPEWYFMFLFQMLKYFPGELEWVGTTILPGLAVLALFLLPFLDRAPERHWKKRRLGVSIMSVIVLGMAGLTLVAFAETPPTDADHSASSSISDQVIAGQDVYALYCVECHGAEGEGGEIKGVEGLEGVILKAINTSDEMYTRSDETLFAIVDYGQPGLGMPPYGLGYGGELRRGDISALVTYMRYTWDDRAEIPQAAVMAASIPALGPGEIPSYDVHVAPIFKRYCISCHRPNKNNVGNYHMGSYEEALATGDYKPNIIAGDLNNNLILMLHRQDIEAGGPMPPTKALKADYIDIIERWVKAGIPRTPQDAAASGAQP